MESDRRRGANRFYRLAAIYFAAILPWRFRFRVRHLEWIATSRWVNFPWLGFFSVLFFPSLSLVIYICIFFLLSPTFLGRFNVTEKEITKRTTTRRDRHMKENGGESNVAHMFLAIVTDTNAHVLLRFVFSYWSLVFSSIPTSSGLHAVLTLNRFFFFRLWLTMKSETPISRSVFHRRSSSCNVAGWAHIL